MNKSNTQKMIDQQEERYNNVVERIIDVAKQLEMETYLEKSLPDVWENVKSNETVKEEKEPIIKQYNDLKMILNEKKETKRMLLDRKAKQSESEEKIKELNEKANKLRDDIGVMQVECDNLLDQIIGFEDDELRILREKKQERDLLAVERRQKIKNNQVHRKNTKYQY